MIHVMASIRVKAGQRDKFLAIFKANVPKVCAEDGCVEYIPAVDIDASIPVQLLEDNVVTIIEKWRDVDALHAHLQATHMLEYKERVKDIVEDVTIKVLQEA